MIEILSEVFKIKEVLEIDTIATIVRKCEDGYLCFISTDEDAIMCDANQLQTEGNYSPTMYCIIENNNIKFGCEGDEDYTGMDLKVVLIEVLNFLKTYETKMVKVNYEL